MEWVEIIGAFVAILLAAELFTNGVEWLGEHYGLSEGAVGSVLAAVGTALPETILPIVAIVFGAERGEEIGTGAILGAPFMLTTLAMFIVGIAVLVPSKIRADNRSMRGDPQVLRHDLGYFVVMYGLAIGAGLLHVPPVKWVLAIALVVGYGFYVRRHMKAPGEQTLEREAVGEIKPLYLNRFLPDAFARGETAPPVWMSFAQVAASLGVMIGGARVFVDGLGTVADELGVPALVFALLVAPLATELPEKFNSVIWVRRDKDTLALGNLTGAMVFQSSFPVTVGLLLTPWHLAHEALVGAVLGLTAGSILYVTMRVRRRFGGLLLLAQGLFYLGYVVYVLVVVV